MPVAEALRRAGIEDLVNRRGTKLSGRRSSSSTRSGGSTVVDPALAAESLATGASPLTPREHEVLLAAGGGTVSDVARRLHLSEGTVRNHLSAAIGKTGARTRAEAVRLAEERGWL